MTTKKQILTNLRVTIRHERNDRLLAHVERLLHNNLDIGILKDAMTDGQANWYQLEFDIKYTQLDLLEAILLYAETAIGYCLSETVKIRSMP